MSRLRFVYLQRQLPFATFDPQLLPVLVNRQTCCRLHVGHGNHSLTCGRSSVHVLRNLPPALLAAAAARTHSLIQKRVLLCSKQLQHSLSRMKQSRGWKPTKLLLLLLLELAIEGTSCVDRRLTHVFEQTTGGGGNNKRKRESSWHQQPSASVELRIKKRTRDPIESGGKREREKGKKELDYRARA